MSNQGNKQKLMQFAQPIYEQVSRLLRPIITPLVSPSVEADLDSEGGSSFWIGHLTPVKGKRASVGVCIESTWPSRAEHFWIGFSGRKDAIEHVVAAAERVAYAPQAVFTEADTEDLPSKRWKFKGNVAEPKGWTPVLEEFHSEQFFGMYNFSSDEEGFKEAAYTFVESVAFELLADEIAANIDKKNTERDALIKARVGQGLFRRRLLARFGSSCLITGISDLRLLRASHLKPWARCSTDAERLDGENGFLLMPTYDVLFDLGLITLSDNLEIEVSSFLGEEVSKVLAIPKRAKTDYELTAKQRTYLEFHRSNVFRRRRL